LANPWEENWAVEAADEKKKKGNNPWELDWDAPPEEVPAQSQPVAAKREDQSYQGSILPFSVDADGNKSFDSDAGLLGAWKRSFMLPGDAMAGNVDPTSEEGIGRALEFAGTMGFGGTKFGSKPAVPAAVADEAIEAAPQASRGFAPLKKLIVGEADAPALVQQRTNDLQAIGIENPTVGMVSGSERAALREQALSPTSNRIQAAQSASKDAVENSISTLAERMASNTNPAARPTSRAELSQALIDQADKVKQAQVTKANELYGKVGELTGDKLAVGDNSRKVLAGLREAKKGLSNSAKLTEGPQLNEAIKHAEAIVKDLDSGATFETIKQARTALGALTNDRSLNPTLKGHLQTLRGAVSEDMGATARATSDEAFSAWKAADDFYKTHKDVDTGFGRGSDPSTLLNKNADTAYDFLMGKSKEGAERIRNLKGQIVQEGGDEVWDRVKGTTLMRVASDKSGAVSGSTYVRNFRQFAPEAKDEIWGKVGTSERDQMETIARAAETLKNYGSKANHSNTENHRAVKGEFTRDSLLAAAVVGGVGWKALAGAAAVKGINAVSRGYQAKMLTNPATREWLSQVPKTGMKKGGLNFHVDRLVEMGRVTNDPSMRVAINEYLQAAGYEQGNR